ncbi:MAG: hypothetical protein JWN86_2773 [Planctomycetota bacterium]|nr:hypothetical protein [Planctomycetota bacterium]
MVVETTRDVGPWTAGGLASVRGLNPSQPPYLGPKGQFGGNHQGGSMVLFADGSVKFIKETVDRRIFEACSTIAGGEVLPNTSIGLSETSRHTQNAGLWPR